MEKLQKAMEAIQKNQAKLKEGSMAYCVGEQLKGIVSVTPEAAELVAQDLENPKLGLEACEKKIAEYARQHREGSTGCCDPITADKIIREFYGIPAAGRNWPQAPKQPEQEKPHRDNAISLADFF